MGLINSIKLFVRSIMRTIAKLINRLSNGRITPDFITWFGFLAHIPIAYLIAYDKYFIAALLLIVFGLFDTLDGELARLQKKSSAKGMLLDASTDRMKEVILYSGIAYSLLNSVDSNLTFVAVIACGASLCVSYIKAKGESAVATNNRKIDHATLNRMFSEGLATFEIRMFLIVLGLILNQLVIVVILIAVLSSYTAFYRLLKISKNLE